jgi:exosortase
MAVPPQVDDVSVTAAAPRQPAATASSLSPTSGGSGSSTSPLAWLAIAALLFIGHLPLLVKYAAYVWRHAEYHFVPLVLLAAAWLAWDRLREARRAGLTPGSPLGSSILLAAAWLCLATGALLWLRILAALGTWLTLAAVAWAFGGPRLLRRLLPVGILLLTTIPPPLGPDYTLGVSLRHLVVRAASAALDFLAVPHVLWGSVIDIPNKRLLIEDACSGIHSFIAIVVFTLTFAILRRRRARATILLLGCAAAYVIALNALRIAGGAWLFYRYRLDTFATPSTHELIGWGLFVSALALVASTDRLLLAWSHWRLRRAGAGLFEDATVPPRPPREARRFVPLRPWAIAAAVFAVTGVLSQLRVAGGWQSPGVRAGAVFRMPDQLAGWQRLADPSRGRPETAGRTSYVWYYRKGTLDVAVALDYPFEGYHHLPECYAASGWLLPQGVVRHDADAAEPLYYEARLQKPAASGAPAAGYLLYALMDERGQWEAPEETEVMPRLRGGAERAAPAATYQLQVLLQSFAAPPTAAQREEVRQFFEACRGQIAPQVLAQIAEGLR